MTAVASLRYGVIFKKAFSVPEIFNAFVADLIGAKVEVDKVETEKSFDPPIGQVDVKFDLFAQDFKNRLVVDIQLRSLPSPVRQPRSSHGVNLPTAKDV